ncbi:branched-chain amino acid ABC transporter permease [Nitratireductor sp. XY-223]|uniref:branched-chain amino acid ABC transporter permease n=1 Tax=Nitratireductor sp. XY-223 TaxID=2561926 RepID=UPI0010AA3ED9|nr:branched-chain amino acid ABC transporter permease [Nitratireductor sp. XY-223]
MDVLGTIIHGLNLAAIYGLMAIGISILWSSVGMINMAHGATFAISGYAAWIASSAAKPLIAAAFGKTVMAKLAMAGVTVGAGTLAGAVFGAIIYLLAFLPIHDKPNFAVRSLIVTLAINLATVQILLWFFGPRQRGLPKLFGFGKFEILGVPIRYDQAGAILSTAIILGLVLFWLRVSRKGLEIRAMMQNPEGAVLSGISVRWTALPVTMLTGALAGLAAILLSQTIFVSPTAGALPLIKGLTIALLGGLGSVPGAVAGAVVIGFLEATVGALPFLGQRYVLFAQFLFIITVLIIRPRGLGGLLDETRE